MVTHTLIAYHIIYEFRIGRGLIAYHLLDFTSYVALYRYDMMIFLMIQFYFIARILFVACIATTGTAYIIGI